MPHWRRPSLSGGWRNLLNVPAVLFWVVRDNPTRTGRQ
jgi:hypothetical protein